LSSKQRTTTLSLSPARQNLFALGSGAFTLLERMVIIFVPFYFLPPAEYRVHNLIPDRTFWGIFTVIGIALVVGRVFDGIADPVIASLSDNSRSRVGRRKLFLLISALPLAIFTILVFSPPHPGQESLLNGVWLGTMMCLFYIAFTAYVNPYLILISELGHSDAMRINLSTRIAFFGLLGMVAVTILFPEIISRLQLAGMEMRASYRAAVMGFAVISAILLYIATFGFDERIHCAPRQPMRIKMWYSLKKTFAYRPFRIFIAGEMFLQFAMNIFTMGSMYYAVVIFLRGQSFLTVLAGIIIGSALLTFPVVNLAAKRWGKKKVILAGMVALTISTLSLFLLSFNLNGLYFYLGLGVLALAGFPLAVLTILVNPTIAEMALADATRTGEHREAMFFGARAVPLKATIALAGAFFGFLISAFGKDVAEPLGVQMSLLTISIAGLGAFLCFLRYPEEEVQKHLN
jgi:glycoside/pentoside/hexuronide:cation symporter, GPH family